MVEQFFSDPRALERARGCAVGPHLDGFMAWLQEAGYASSSIETFARTAVHLGVWTQRCRAAIADLDEIAIERFRAHLRECACPGPRPPRRRYHSIAARADRFLEYLREQGVVPQAPAPELEQVHPLIEGFQEWMCRHRGTTPTTQRIYRRIVTGALEALGDEPSTYSAGAVRGYVLARSREHGRSKAKLVATAMRVFLRYLIAAGVCRPGLDGAVPTIAHWRLAALPRYLSPPDVDRVLATCNPATTAGLRNRAMLLLMVRLGLRAGDLAALHLEDIEWQDATLQVQGKSRRAARLPLPQEVGDSILAYLPRRQPQVSSTRLFLRLTPPWGPIERGTVTSVVRAAIRAAGVVTPARGAHVLRHSAAREMLRQGASLDQVRIALRHSDPETTRLYAKVDVTALRQIAQPWPEVTPC